MKITRLLPILLLLLAAFFQPVGQPARAASDAPLVLVLDMDGIIFPAMQEYLDRGIRTAEQRDAGLLVIQLNTPGGDVNTTIEMVQIIRSSLVPVVVYVAPRSAWAASAGTIITLAGHASAMAPETTIGAASPVSGEGQDLGEAMEAKAKEIMKATVRSLAERRGQEVVDLAEATIEEAKAVYAKEALAIGLVDFIAEDLDDLLAQLDGFVVETSQGPVTLDTGGAVVDDIGMTLIEQLLQMLTNPNIVFLLLSIGVQAILIEISSPGGWVAGFIGAVCLALAAYGLGVLPVNWFGIIFLIIAFALFILDIKAPTHGALTAAGIGSFIAGALLLFNSPSTPQFQRVSIPLVILVALLTGASFAVILGFALRALRRPVSTGQESLAGQTGIAKTAVNPDGQVQAAGELWSAVLAEGSEKIRKGDRVAIVRVEGLRLRVRKL